MTSAVSLALQTTRIRWVVPFFSTLLLLCWTRLPVPGQVVYPYAYPRPESTAAISEMLDRLLVCGSVLYVAAHPDDENTRLIAWLAGERKVQTTYLSLTRGDGGQNLIGTEMAEMLGVLRTQELLMARGVDLGEQMFTRANDFGYSKHPDETMRIWDREAVLSDVVWAIRKTRPDVIINRFDHRSPGTTHGHHTASAMLALEAFRLAADPAAFPEQLIHVDTWQPGRIFFNTSWWFYGSQEAFEQADKSQLIQIPTGAFNAARGMSYTEIAARSRSMHRCQGFGSTGTRGESREYLEWLDGVPLPFNAESGSTNSGDAAAADPFQGLSVRWDRYPGGDKVERWLMQARDSYNPRDPSGIVPDLVRAWSAMQAIPDEPLVRRRQGETLELIRLCLGLWIEARANQPQAAPGDSISVELELIQRLGEPVRQRSASIYTLSGEQLASASSWPQSLPNNRVCDTTLRLRLPDKPGYSTAYWLLQPASTGLYRVPNEQLRGLPESPPALEFRVELEITGQILPLAVPVIYRENDPAFGERYRRFDVLPPAVLQVQQPVYLFPDAQTRVIRVIVKALRDQVEGRLVSHWPEGWTPGASPEFSLSKAGEEQVLEWTVKPPDENAVADLILELDLNGKRYPYAMKSVAYDHIPAQTVLLPAQVRLSRLDLGVAVQNIAYIMGAGDEVPAALREIGCRVTLLEDDDLRADGLAERLSTYDAVVAGVRAYNTRDALKGAQSGLMEYVRQGGTYLVQYNTNRGLVMEQTGPYPLKLGRDRVTEEDADVELLQPQHDALSRPNALSSLDFDGWVQERGLYFPAEWDAAYSALLGMSDSGESEQLHGSLLVAPYGNGWFVYSGLSFFRELPNGVPGAFRLFANLISLGKT